MRKASSFEKQEKEILEVRFLKRKFSYKGILYTKRDREKNI